MTSTSHDQAYWDANNVAQLDYAQARLASGRNDAFSQLDLRIDKKWFFETWSLDVFMDLQNLFGQVADSPDALDVVRDGTTGGTLVGQMNPSRYQARYIPLGTGSAIPAVGLIVEL